jgi:hypothetical protein
MRRVLQVLAVSVGTAALVVPGTAAVASAQGGPPPPAFTCTGGHWNPADPASSTFVDIPSGTWSSITVTGVCDVPADAVVNVVGNVNLGPGAVLDAQSAPSTITVGQNVTAAAGSILGLGCQPDTEHTRHPCVIDPGGSSVINVNGNLTATGADTVLLNGTTVNGNVTLTGGGGDIPWSIKWNTIGGNFTVSGVTADWFGALFNSVGRNATLTNITATDPEDTTPPVYVVQNTIGWNLNCMGLGPALVAGFSPLEPLNTVGRNATGQCASLAVRR